MARNQGGGKGGNQAPKNVVHDETFFYSWLTQNLNVAARKLGGGAFDTPVFKGMLNLSDANNPIRQVLTSQAITTLGAAFEGTNVLKSALGALGIVGPVSTLVINLVVEVLEGLKAAYEEGGQQLTGAQVAQVTQASHQAKAKLQAGNAFGTAFRQLDGLERSALMDLVLQMNAEQKTLFEAYKPQLDVVVLKTITDPMECPDVASVFTFLSFACLTPPKSVAKEAGKGLLDFAKKAHGALTSPKVKAVLDDVTDKLVKGHLEQEWQQVLRRCNPIYTMEEVATHATCMEQNRTHKHVTLLEAYVDMAPATPTPVGRGGGLRKRLGKLIAGK